LKKESERTVYYFNHYIFFRYLSGVYWIHL